MYTIGLIVVNVTDIVYNTKDSGSQ